MKQYKGAMIGKKYNSLTVLEALSCNKYNSWQFLCQCDCGELREVNFAALTRNATKMCKTCASIVLSKKGILDYKHNMTGTPIYKSWTSLRNRCKHPPSKVYETISCCKAWESFEQFYTDMVDTHFKHAQLHRKNNILGYDKDNCMWLTLSDHTKVHNRRTKCSSQ